ncbi:MAG TPA: formate dehydrogenase accessory sulfurtransferase FdhD [Burkholderiales bacterium]|nr:formate dehydrogenase accessory sulfurtransferase FdhD [Burkholderiales bacterium]
MKVDDSAPGALGSYPVTRWDAGELTDVTDRVAEEAPVSFVYNGLAYAVMMASPADLEDYAVGFSISEGVVSARDELHRVDILELDDGILIRIEIPEARTAAIEVQRRNMAGRTACGLCGAESIEQVLRHLPRVPSGSSIAHPALQGAFEALGRRQSLNAITGAVHAAAWVSHTGELVLVREDVGRHNALDKLIGAMLRGGMSTAEGAALITSRASFEMAQKAAMVGIPILAAISAPTGLAIRLARESGLTLVGFARNGRHNVYTHPERLHDG